MRRGVAALLAVTAFSLSAIAPAWAGCAVDPSEGGFGSTPGGSIAEGTGSNATASANAGVQTTSQYVFVSRVWFAYTTTTATGTATASLGSLTLHYPVSNGGRVIEYDPPLRLSGNGSTAVAAISLPAGGVGVTGYAAFEYWIVAKTAPGCDVDGPNPSVNVSVTASLAGIPTVAITPTPLPVNVQNTPTISATSTSSSSVTLAGFAGDGMQMYAAVGVILFLMCAGSAYRWIRRRG